MTPRRRDYRLHELTFGEFEELCSKICIDWLGPGFTPFAEGKDGGRDGRFNGKAQRFPSLTAPLKGKAVIQAKHTSASDKSCSNSDFQTLMKKEHPKVGNLVESNLCDHYIVFTNRKLSGGTEATLYVQLIALKLNTAHIVGKERLKLELDGNEALRASLPNALDSDRFTFHQEDLVEVIEAFASFVGEIGNGGLASELDLSKVPMAEKNVKNGLTSDYYENSIVDDSLPQFGRVRTFLENPRSRQYADMYADAADELKRLLISERSRFENFDSALDHIIKRVQETSEALKGRRRLATILVHYMYCNCDIGMKA